TGIRVGQTRISSVRDFLFAAPDARFLPFRSSAKGTPPVVLVRIRFDSHRNKSSVGSAVTHDFEAAAMAGALVDRATSDMLMRPDWAMNVQICDILNRDPGYALLFFSHQRNGVVFPQKCERSSPVCARPQARPLRSHPPPVRSPEFQNKARGSSIPPAFPVLRCCPIILSATCNIL
ncbi:hypothetical protein BHM03_00019683, partial [Ensete ventricosum]